MIDNNLQFIIGCARIWQYSRKLVIQTNMRSDVTKAMILAAGEGTRLRPLTLETPKVLLPVGEVPLIEHQLSWLKSHGVSQVAINLYHLGEQIKAFLGDGSRFEMKLLYSLEETLLGTAGGVKRVKHFFDDTFVVVYGDVLTDFNLSEMIRFHQEKKSMATLAVMAVTNPCEVGVIEMDEEKRIIRFVEKPPRDSVTGDLSSGGVYVLEKETINNILGDGFSDFAYDVFPKLIELNIPIYGYILRPGDNLIDIGTINNYNRANEDVSTGKVKIIYR